MNITRWAIENSRVTAVGVLIIILGGAGAYFSLPRAEDPGFTIRTAQIVTVFPGASPERVEALVTDKIEKGVMEMPELDFVSSESKTGTSIVYVNIKEKYSNMRPIWDKLRRKMDAVEPDLPDGIIGPTVNDDFGDTYGIVIGITGEGFSYAELKEVADEVRDELLLIDEVSKVEILGAQEERVFVEYNNARLSQLGMTPGQLQQILVSRNIIIPGGDIIVGIEEIVLEPSGNFESIDDLRQTVITIPGSRQVTYLDDVVKIYRGYIDPPESVMRTNGQPSLGLAISLREGGNITVMGNKVTELVESLPELYPHGVDFEVVTIESERVNAKVDDFVSNVFQSILIVLFVMLIVLGLRTGLVVASLIPTTMVMTLLVMSALDIGLDQVSLAALIIALGMLVDNAIVMAESIIVQIQRGKPPIDAAISSAKELRIPLLTSSLTTCTAFLPIYLAESIVGEFTEPLFKVVSISLLCSWFLALTLTPVLCVTFLASQKKSGGIFALIKKIIGRKKHQSLTESDSHDSSFYRVYRRLLITLLKVRYLTVAGAIVVFAIAMMGFGLLPQMFFPSDESKQFTATFRLPRGTPIEVTRTVMTEVEQHLQAEMLAGEERPEGITGWATFIGAGAPRYQLSYNPEPPSPEYAFMIINSTSKKAANQMIAELEAWVFDNFPDLDAKIKGKMTGPPVKNPIEVRLSGSNSDQLFAIAEETKQQLRSMSGTKNITDNWGPRTKKIVLNVSQPRAFRAGVTNHDVAISMLTNLSGIETSQYREEDRVIPIILRSAKSDRSDIGKLDSLNIYANATGQNVPLKQVSDSEIEFEPSKILRRDRRRTINISSQLETGITAQELNTELIPWLEERSEAWGMGVRWDVGGEAESSEEANKSIGDKMPIAGLIILLLLVIQFNSLRRTFIIIFTIPLALIGVVVGLLLAKSYFGFMTLLGIVSLAGIVINNAIVLLERIKLEIEENGLKPQQAIVVAAERRMRPILMTTATTIGGLIPLWLGGGPMWEPMAIAIIFGLLFSTVLTLGVVPALYAILFRLSFKGFRYEP